MNLSFIPEKFQELDELACKQRSIFEKSFIKNVMRIGMITVTILIANFQLLFSLPLKSQPIDQVEVKMGLNNETLVQAFQKIEAQSPFRFMYRNEEVKNIRNLYLPVTEKNVEQILKIILSKTDLVFRQVNNQILIMTAKAIVKGKVTNSKGEPLAGVSITIKGENTGTSTDQLGNYSITIPPGGILIFTYVGYTAQEVAVSNQTTINVQLREGTTALNEVIVTALGIRRSVRSLTYSAQTINRGELNEAKETNFINSLQGKVAGVTITRSATGPGGESSVLLRGNRSLSGNNQPLYVIDGVPLSGGIEMLNPDNIESMTVLKGPAAAALYGSQGQNGAIIITSRSGTNNKIAVDYNGGFAIDQAAVLPDLQYQYGQGDGGIYNANSEHSWGPRAQGQMVTLWNGDVVPLQGQPNRLKEFFRTAGTVTNSISASAGNDKMRAYFSYGNTLAQGIMRNNDLARHNIDLKFDANISSKLSFSTKLTYINEGVNNRVVPGEGGTYALPSIYRAPTSIPTNEMEKYSYIDSTGTERQSYWKPGSSILGNPYWLLNRVTYYRGRDRMLGLVMARYKFNEWLNLQVRGSIDKTITQTNNKIWQDNYFSLVGSDYNSGYNTNQSTNLDVLLSFNHSLTKNFDIFGNIGGASQQGNYSTVAQAANGLNVANFFFMSNAKNPFITDLNGKYPQVMSVYATATLSYEKFLYLDITGRNDWSTALSKNNNSYFYPSIGLSAVFSSLLHLPSWISYGKARLTFANSGNGGQQYLNRNYYSVGAGGSIITPTIQSLGDYKPELTSSIETGLEMQFFNNRIGFDLTYYSSKSKNQLLLISTPAESLFNQKYINAGLITNKGIELMVNATPIKGRNFSWDAAINYSKNKNKVVELTNGVNSVVLNYDREATIEANVGGSYGDMYVKDWQKDALGRRLVDNNGMPILTAGNTVYLGNYNPNYMLGFSNTFSYKNFSLSFLIDYRNGGYIIAGTQALIDADGHSQASLNGRESGLVLDGYTADGKKNIQTITSQAYYSAIGDRYPTGGLYAYSATNMRLRELTFGYSLSKKGLGDKSFIKNVKFSVVGRNLFFFQRSAPIDPEITEGTGVGGLEYGAYPSTRNIGINIKFSF